MLLRRHRKKVETVKETPKEVSQEKPKQNKVETVKETPKEVSQEKPKQNKKKKSKGAE